MACCGVSQSSSKNEFHLRTERFAQVRFGAQIVNKDSHLNPLAEMPFHAMNKAELHKIRANAFA